MLFKSIFSVVKSYLNKESEKDSWGKMGFIISFVGTLLLVISVTEDPNSLVRGATSDITYHYAIISSIGVKLGLSFWLVGFFFELLERTVKTPIVKQWHVIMFSMIPAIIAPYIIYILTILLFR